MGSTDVKIENACQRALAVAMHPSTLKRGRLEELLCVVYVAATCFRKCGFPISRSGAEEPKNVKDKCLTRVIS